MEGLHGVRIGNGHNLSLGPLHLSALVPACRTPMPYGVVAYVSVNKVLAGFLIGGGFIEPFPYGRDKARNRVYFESDLVIAS